MVCHIGYLETNQVLICKCVCVFLWKHESKNVLYVSMYLCVAQVTVNDNTKSTWAEALLNCFFLHGNIQGPDIIMYPTISLLHFSHSCPQPSLALRGWCSQLWLSLWSQSFHPCSIILSKSAAAIMVNAMRLCVMQHPIFTFISSYCSIMRES